MNLVRCVKGHFYDKDRYPSCPHCGTADIQNDNPTVSLTQGDISSDVTQQLDPGNGIISLQDAVEDAGIVPARDIDEDSKTVGYYAKNIGTEPVVGWLVCTEGNHFGEDYKLKTGRNFIGRGTNMDVAITGDNTVSRERHAVVVYDPKTHAFLVQPGDSKELCYLNDEVVLSAMKIELHDILTLGATKLIFIPCCSEKFNWDLVTKETE